MNQPFEIGEIINPEDWGLRIRITCVEPLEAVVIKSEPASEYARTWAEKYFPVGKVIRFIAGTDNAWRIDTNDHSMPWFILGIYDGRKSFTHYR